MPDLRELLHEAGPSGAPGFDADDVRDRVAAAERRQRRTVGALMAAVLLVVVVGVGTSLRSDQTAFVDTPSVWPSTVTFAGAQIEISVGVEPLDLTGFLEPGDTITQVGASTDDDGRVSLWFTCGGAEVVRIREAHDPAAEPALPVAALAEAVTQLAAAQGCTPEPPPGTPDVLLDGGIGLAGLARAIDDAGMTACCATVALVPMADRPGVDGTGITAFRAVEGAVAWGVQDGGAEPLRFTADLRSWTPTDLATPELLPLADGHVAADRIDGVGLVVASTCGMATLQTRTEADGLPRWEAFLRSIGCTPTAPEGLGPTLDLLALLTDLGLTPDAAPSDDVTVASARVVVEGEPLLVRSGGLGQVGLPESAMGDLPAEVGTFTGTGAAWPSEVFEPASLSGPDPLREPLGGAFAICTITHAIFAASEAGLDRAADLAGRIRAHPDCATVGLPEGAPPMPAQPPPTAEPTPDAAGPTPDPNARSTYADHVIAALEAAGLPVTDITENGPLTDFRFQPRPVAGEQPALVEVSLAGPDAPPPVVTADTEIVPLADGEGVVLPGTTLVAFHCGGAGLITTSVPGAATDLAWIEQLPQAVGCRPRPPAISRDITTDDGTVVPRSESIREARLREALEALGVEPCCGEPSHGGTGAATGMVWEGVPIGIMAASPPEAYPASLSPSTVIELADGQAALSTDELPQVRFTCGHTTYTMGEFIDAVPDDAFLIRAAEALIGELGCTPTVGPPSRTDD